MWACQPWLSSWGVGLKARMLAMKTRGISRRQPTLVDVGENTALSDGDMSKKLVQLLVVANGELEMAGNDAGLLVIASGVTSQLENFSGQVFKDGSEVDGST